MGLAVRRLSLQTGALAVILLALTASACVASFAHAGMVMMPGQDCSGPGCERIVCARSDRATAPSRELADPLVATAVAAAISVSPPPRQTTPVAPTVSPPSRRPLSPLAPRSPPAA